ncbi:MAG: hypothetical protein KIT62_13465 [Cyclobacteriaceae bacterium]|nr:hypothetical protein [Cyclobacteriaceae bacterium]
MTAVLPVYANDPVDVIRTRNENQFIFKVDREMLGAHVVVLSEEGTPITSQRLMKRKMIIDFSDVRAGYYTIVVKKDGKVEKFEYVRNWR